MSSAICLNLEQSKILWSGNGLNKFWVDDFWKHTDFVIIIFIFNIKVQKAAN